MTGQYSESPVGSPDCMIFWPAGDMTKSTKLSASDCSALGALASIPMALGRAVTGSRNLTLMPGVLRLAPMPAELWTRASLMMPASRAASVLPLVRLMTRPLLLRSW